MATAPTRPAHINFNVRWIEDSTLPDGGYWEYGGVRFDKEGRVTNYQDLTPAQYQIAASSDQRLRYYSALDIAGQAPAGAFGGFAESMQAGAAPGLSALYFGEQMVGEGFGGVGAPQRPELLQGFTPWATNRLGQGISQQDYQNMLTDWGKGGALMGTRTPIAGTGAPGEYRYVDSSGNITIREEPLEPFQADAMGFNLVGSSPAESQSFTYIPGVAGWGGTNMTDRAAQITAANVGVGGVEGDPGWHIGRGDVLRSMDLEDAKNTIYGAEGLSGQDMWNPMNKFRRDALEKQMNAYLLANPGSTGLGLVQNYMAGGGFSAQPGQMGPGATAFANWR